MKPSCSFISTNTDRLIHSLDTVNRHFLCDSREAAAKGLNWFLECVSQSAHSKNLSLRLRAIFVFLVQPRVAVLQADFFARQPHPRYMGAEIENVPIGGEDRRFFAGLNGAEAIRHASQLRRIQRKALERFRLRQAEGD